MPPTHQPSKAKAKAAALIIEFETRESSLKLKRNLKKTLRGHSRCAIVWPFVNLDQAKDQGFDIYVDVVVCLHVLFPQKGLSIQATSKQSRDSEFGNNCLRATPNMKAV